MNSMIRFSPASELRRMQNEIDRLFENYFPVRSNSMDEEAASVFTPRLDLFEESEAYVIELDLPGVTKESLDINIHDGVLSINGERKLEATGQRTTLRTERFFGRFFRSFTLPKTIAADGIEATFRDGVLTVRVPKAEESKPRRIEIQ